MLNGAAKAARKAGALTPEKVWIVMVPVVVILVLDRLAHFLLFWYSLNPRLDVEMWFVAGGAEVPLRDMVVLVTWAATGYTGVWACTAITAYGRAVGRTGRRILVPVRSLARLFILGGLFLVTAYAATLTGSLPTTDDVVASARQDANLGNFGVYRYAVCYRVPGIRAVGEELRAEKLEPHRFLGAAGLHYLGDRSEETLAVLASVDFTEIRGRSVWEYDFAYLLGWNDLLPPREDFWDHLEERFR